MKTKSHFGKRVLSLVLSVLMVVTMLPTFAFTASATNLDNHLVGRFFVDGLSNFLDNGVTLQKVGTGATWTREWVGGSPWDQYKAGFDGTQNNYYYVNSSDINKMLGDVDENTGFTFAFKGARVAENVWNRFFDFIDGDAYSDNSTNYLFISAGNQLAEAKSATGTTSRLTCPGTWDNHNWIITAANGYFSVYCDGELTGTISSNVINAAWFTALKTNGKLLFGASAFRSDPGFDGCIRDFRIYDKAVSAAEAKYISDDITAKLNETTPAPAQTSDDWQIMASTDFTKTEWTKSESYNWYTSSSPTVEGVGGNPMGWNIQFRDDEPTVTQEGDGVKFWYNSGSDHNQGLIYLSSYNNQTANNIFNGVDNFKIDITFSLFDTTKANSGYANNQRRGEQSFFKLCYDSSYKYGFTSRNTYERVYYAQESWGRRHMNGNSDIYAGNGTQEGSNYAISTYNSNISANTDYHYVVYVKNGLLCSYVVDDSDNVIINYDPIDISSYSLSPADITGMYINASEFNIFGYEDLENVLYKNIIIYKNNAQSSSYDSSKDHYLLTYFTDNNAAGETLHYAVSEDGVNFDAVNLNNKVWNESDYSASSIAIYPKGTERGSIGTSRHIRDPYVLRAQDGSYYILATDLNTNGGTVYSNGSKVLVWHMDKLTDIPDTEPWVIDATAWKTSIISAADGDNKNGAVTRFWAPQAIWDSTVGKYMLYFSAGKNTSSDTTYMYYTYTSDFKTFTTPKRLITDGSYNTIDGDITYYNGLYYMWYKREANPARIAMAVAPSASGPYQFVKSFEVSASLEGPTVYQTSQNGWAMIADAYTDPSNTFVYTASTPYGFAPSISSQTNITSDLNYRHGCVTKITGQEYEEILGLKVSSILYKWKGVGTKTDGWGSDQTGIKDNASDTMTYTFMHSRGTMTANTGKLVFAAREAEHYEAPGWYDAAGGAVQLTNSEIPGTISRDEYTIDFSFKLGSGKDYNTFPLADHTIFAIFNGSTNYVRLAADGTFYVNDEACSPKVTVSSSESVQYTIVHNGYSTAIMVNGEYVCGAVNTEAIPSGATVALGWSTSPQNNYRILGEYGPLSMSQSALNIGTKELLYAYADKYIQPYLTKMKDTTKVYRNMADAYKAYVDLNEAVDAVKYGDSATAQLVAAADALGTATAAMTQWTPATGVSVYSRDSDTAINSSYAKNIIYADRQDTLVDVTGDGDNEVRIQIQYGANNVLLYDGTNDILYPVSVFYYNNRGWANLERDRQVYTLYPYSGTQTALPSDNTNFRLQGPWNGQLNYGTADWNTAYGKTTHIPGYQQSLGKTPDGAPGGTSAQWNYFANYMKYVGGDSGFSNGLKSFQVSWYAFSGYSSTKHTKDHYLNNAGYFYLIDYSTVEATINSYKGYIDDVEAYKEGGMLTFLETFDKMTVDVNGANYSTDAASEAARVAKSIYDGENGIADAYNDSETDVARGKGYIDIRSAIDKKTKPNAVDNSNGFSGASFSVRSIIENNGYLTYNGHTVRLTKYDTFKTAYNNAVKIMADLGESGLNTNKNSNYANPSTDAANAASALVDAYNNLDCLYYITFSTYGGALETDSEVEAGAANTNIPDNTTPADNGDETHTIYSWPAAASDNHIVWENEVYSEESSVAACNHNTKKAHTEASGEINGYYDYACSVCGHVNEANREWDPHTTEWTNYKTLADRVATNKVSDAYTTDSKGYYTTACAVADGVDTTVANVERDDPSKSEDYINAKIEILEDAEAYLNPLAEYPTLLTHSTERATNNGGSGTQLYTYTSWKSFAAAYDAGKEIYDAAPNKSNIGMYEVNASTHIVDKTDKTAQQESIEAANNVTNPAYNALESGALDSTDLASYTTYESARDVISASLDTKKYTQAGINNVTGAINTANGQLYHKLATDDEAAAYNALIGVNNYYKKGQLVKDSNNSELIDGDTTNIMSAATTINTGKTYIRQYDIQLTVQDEETGKAIDYDNAEEGFENGVKTYTGNYYGDTVNITLPGAIVTDYSVANWSTSNLNDSDEAESSAKASSRTSTTLTKVVNGKMAITAELSKKASSTTYTYQCNIYDAYGSLVEVMYGNKAPTTDVTTRKVTVDGKEYIAKVIPFYDLNSWNVTQNGNVYTIKPVYTVEQRYTISVTGDNTTISKTNPKYDEKVTITYDGNANFVAWAALKDNKYQIASYNSTYSFYACANEAYIPIVNTGTSETPVYKDINGVAINASNIEGVIADGLSAENKNAIVTAKIKNRVAFISTQAADMYGDNTKARIYLRLTYGADTTGGFGVLFHNGSGANVDEQMYIGGSGTYRRAVTSVLSTGQFTYTLNKSGGFTDNVTYRGYVNYDVTYKIDGKTSTINGNDYSAIAVAYKV